MNIIHNNHVITCAKDGTKVYSLESQGNKCNNAAEISELSIKIQQWVMIEENKNSKHDFPI